MNQKAIKQQIEFPPLINLQEDQPAIHNDFRSDSYFSPVS